VLKLIHGASRGQAGRAQRAVDDLAPLVRDAQKGSRDAIRQLIVAVAPGILKAVRRIMGASDPDVEDIVIEATYGFVSALPRFQNDCSIGHFAARIGAHGALKVVRTRKARPVTVGVDDVEGAASASPEPSPLEQMVARRERLVLRDLLGTLPESQAEALVLHVALGYTVDEIAAAIAVPVNTVRGRLQSAKTALRFRVSQDGELKEMLSEVES
jgi:RNA polymerase sigma-70 factor, ECF subfamily